MRKHREFLSFQATFSERRIFISVRKRKGEEEELKTATVPLAVFT